MRKLPILTFLCCLPALLTAQSPEGYYRLPTIHGETVVFAAEGDLWQVGLDGGMATVVGRIRTCPVLDFKFVVLTHNTLRGAARGAILLGELIRSRGLIS